jgi:hypothetical protein
MDEVYAGMRIAINDINIKVDYRLCTRDVFLNDPRDSAGKWQFTDSGSLRTLYGNTVSFFGCYFLG